jgi:DNA polymerase-3 subunit gamma/tau
MSLYRTYRPQNFTDLLGQEEISATLKSQLASKKWTHAYLFVGPRGIGKTTTARIVAKVLNCASPKDGEPCNRCESCRAITDGRHLDIIEIDAASNRGIDEVRDLREKIKLSPTQGKFKVYIIDEVHMLTSEAFNALLKTLEEPPAHAVFILCTTEAHKIPATVSSRCQRFEFERASTETSAELIKKIAKKESLEVEKEAVAAVAAAADGSFRDALMILEQVSSSGKVSLEKVEKLTRRSSQIEKLFKLIESENAVDSIKFVGELHLSGVNLSHLSADLVRKFREELLQAVAEANDVRQLKLTGLIKIFSSAHADLKQAVLPTLPLELAIIEAVGTKERLVKQVVEEVVSEVAPEDLATPAKESVASPGLTELKENWDRLLRGVKPFNHSLEAFLRGSEPHEVTEKIVTLKFFYKFHKDMVDQPKNREMVEKQLAELFGRDMRVKTVLGERTAKKVRADEVKNVEPVNDEDLVQKAVDIFNSGIS